MGLPKGSKPEHLALEYSSCIPQSYSQLPRKPTGVVLAAVTDLPQEVFLGRRPSSVRIPRAEACPRFVPGLPQRVFHGGRSTSRPIPRAEASNPVPVLSTWFKNMIFQRICNLVYLGLHIIFASISTRYAAHIHDVEEIDT